MLLKLALAKSLTGVPAGSRRGWGGGKRTNGVKRHIAVDVNGQPLTVVATAASIQDRDAAHRILPELRGSSLHYPAHLGRRRLPGRLLGWAKSVLALQVEIIRRIPGASGSHVRPRVWVVERTFAWINKYRRCVRAYESRPEHHEAVIHISMIGLMTRRLVRT
ncbi:transposase [Rhodococcus sp. IEGM 1379]|uniref:transposase n=1 Tax=Rhodococcus sp. IEGM 1379 TaxID=3047086 RepID=UPI0024B667D3|nr:transposase [Rhodococcus sp. IEGM 1379]MDI9917300.1 transposase [Rhodococcus sp. IEGM 1379]